MLAHLLALAAAATTPAPQPYDANDEAAARAWIAMAGHRFDPAAPLPADLQPLIDRLKGARVIGIGEVTHGTHNDQAFKAELIKALIRAGAVDMLAIECNRAAGAAFDRYVVTGDGDPAALLRSPSFFATWRDDEFAGLLLWLRAWNQVAATPVHVVGIDHQDAGVDAAAAIALVRRHDPATADLLTRQFGTMLGEPGSRPPRYADWAIASEAGRYLPAQRATEALRALLANPPAKWRTDPDLPEAREAAERAWEGLKVFERNYKGATPPSDTDMDYAARRDGFMAQSLTRVVGGARVALWAHDLHVMWSPWGQSAGAANLGTFLRRTYGDGYRSVGFSWSRATIHTVALPSDAPGPPVAERVYSDVPLTMTRPGDLAHVFAPLPGDAWWIDMTTRPHTPALDRWGKRPLTHGFAGWRLDPVGFEDDRETELDLTPDRGFDVLVWFRAMAPARAWPEKAATPTRAISAVGLELPSS